MCLVVERVGVVSEGIHVVVLICIRRGRFEVFCVVLRTSGCFHGPIISSMQHSSGTITLFVSFIMVTIKQGYGFCEQ